MDIILRIVCHAEINKQNKKNITEGLSKVTTTRILQMLRGTYTTQECIDCRVSIYFLNQCWIKHQELAAKYSLRQMRTRGLNRSLKRAASPAESEQKEMPAALEIESEQPKVLIIVGPYENC